MALFQAWLPHLTRNAVEGPPAAPDDWRLHHTAYARFGTEYFGWVVRAYREAREEMCVEQIGAQSSE